jgi:hypothetical protein
MSHRSTTLRAVASPLLASKGSLIVSGRAEYPIDTAASVTGAQLRVRPIRLNEGLIPANMPILEWGPKGELDGDAVAHQQGSPVWALDFADADATYLNAVIGAPDTANQNSSYPGALYLEESTAAAALHGYYWPATPPFTVITKVVSDNLVVSNHAVMLFVLPASGPGALRAVGISGTARNAHAWSMTSSTAGPSSLASADGHLQPYYLALRVNSTTSMDFLISKTGYIWRPLLLAHDPSASLTVGAFGVGIRHQSAGRLTAAFDYIRRWPSALTLLGSA